MAMPQMYKENPDMTTIAKRHTVWIYITIYNVEITRIGATGSPTTKVQE